MAGQTFAASGFQQRVIGNKIQSGANYVMPEGWDSGAPSEGTWKMGGSEERCDWALVVLEPDKTLNLKKALCSKRTYIQMFKKTEELVEVLQGQSVEKLQELMGLSEKTAKSHAERFQSFHKLPPKQAALIFGGEALRADDFGSDESYVETHLRIVSGLYGVLRPYDDVKPVRDLPFGAKLATKKGETVADFWGDAIPKQLAKDGNPGGGKKPLMFLCVSDDYLGAIQYQTFEKDIKVVRVCFEGSDEEAARRGRSKIGRWILRQRLTNRDDLHEWEDVDWKLDKFKSSSAKVTFTWLGDGPAPSKKDKEKKSKKDGAEKAERSVKEKDRKKEKREAASSSRSPAAASGDGGRSRSRSKRKSGKGRKQASGRERGRSQSRSRSRSRRGGGRRG